MASWHPQGLPGIPPKALGVESSVKNVENQNQNHVKMDAKNVPNGAGIQNAPWHQVAVQAFPRDGF